MNDVSRLGEPAADASDEGEAAFDVLVRALWPNAYRISWSILGERRDADDAAQAACAAICTKPTTLADPQTHARDRARVKSRLHVRESLGYAEATTFSRSDDPCIRIDLENAIAGLPELLRLPLECANLPKPHGRCSH